jgi:hypothetical protein
LPSWRCRPVWILFRVRQGLALEGRTAGAVSRVRRRPSVNWSEELEELYADESRTHLIDVRTRSAIVAALGELEATRNDRRPWLPYRIPPVGSQGRSSRRDARRSRSRLFRPAQSACARARGALASGRRLCAPTLRCKRRRCCQRELARTRAGRPARPARVARVLRPGACAVVVAPFGPALSTTTMTGSWGTPVAMPAASSNGRRATPVSTSSAAAISVPFCIRRFGWSRNGIGASRAA